MGDDKMTELIVALDCQPWPLWYDLHNEAGVRWFKLGVQAMFSDRFFSTVDGLRRAGCNLFLDLKLYDTRDTVARIAGDAFELGATFLTVHATPSMLDIAIAMKTAERQKVLAVGPLTDGSGTRWPLTITPMNCDGFIYSVAALREARLASDAPSSKIFVCPGIRPVGYVGYDNHTFAATPAEARAAGADYIVVGRPIYAAPAPVAAARAIMAELE